MRGLPRCRSLLVIAPHPDDEAIAAWALMRHVARSGGRVDVIVVSDGGASHPNSAAWPVHRLVRERRRESLRALRTLDLSPSRVRFLGLPDGALADHDRLLRKRLARAVLGRGRPQLIVAPLPDDAHHDHRSVASALACLPRRGERRLGYRVWPKCAGRRLHGITVPLDGGAMRLKRRVVRSYRTQAGAITDATAGFTMTHRHLRAFVRPCERFAVIA